MNIHKISKRIPWPEPDHGSFQVLDDVFRRHFRRTLAALPQICSSAVEGALRLVQEERDGKASGRGVLSHGGTPNSWIVYFREKHHLEMDDDLEVALF